MLWCQTLQANPSAFRPSLSHQLIPAAVTGAFSVSIPFVSEPKEFGPNVENQPFHKRNKIIALLCYFEYDKWASAKQMIIRSKTMARWKEFTPCLGWGCLDNEEGGWGTEGWKGRREPRAWSDLRKHQTRWFMPSCSQRRHFITLSYSSLLGKDAEKAPRLSQTAFHTGRPNHVHLRS